MISETPHLNFNPVLLSTQLIPSTHIHTDTYREGVEKDSKEENNEKEYKEAQNKPLKPSPHNELKRLKWG